MILAWRLRFCTIYILQNLPNHLFFYLKKNTKPEVRDEIRGTIWLDYLSKFIWLSSVTVVSGSNWPTSVKL